MKSMKVYLRVTLDAEILWIEHDRSIRQKVSNILNKLFQIADINWIRKPYILKFIVQSTIILYGAEVWGYKNANDILVRHLEAIERPFLLDITKTYRIAPTVSFHVLAGITPLQVDARVSWDSYTK